MARWSLDGTSGRRLGEQARRFDRMRLVWSRHCTRLRYEGIARALQTEARGRHRLHALMVDGRACVLAVSDLLVARLRLTRPPLDRKARIETSGAFTWIRLNSRTDDARQHPPPGSTCLDRAACGARQRNRRCSDRWCRSR